MKIYWATKLRGFFKHMSLHMPSVEFVEKKGHYETQTIMTRLKSHVIRHPLLNRWGIFQVIRAHKQECDAYGSFNRFLNTDKPYFIYLENPTALYHYTLGRIQYKKGRDRFEKCLNDSNLRYIVCMSEACRNSFEKINMAVPKHLKMTTIYPFVPENPNIDESIIQKKSFGESLECLYCVQGIRFISKGGLEILSAYERLRRKGYKIRLTVITKLDDLDKDILTRLMHCEEISLRDFNYKYEELEKIYSRTNVLLQPSSDDSFGLTVLEAMKGGCAVICSCMYAFPEMVTDGKNGFLLEPKYWFFDQNNIPNPKVWNYRNTTVHSRKESEVLIEQLEEKLAMLCKNRDILERMSVESLKLSKEKFGESTICSAWDEVWTTLGE